MNEDRPEDRTDSEWTNETGRKGDRTESASNHAGAAAVKPTGGAGEVFGTALRLGLTSFGGPIAHLGYFRDEYVRRRQWLDEKSYADLVALCQFLPGPASSQVGIGIGWMRAGFLGALAAWIGFTMPSVLALLVFAYAITGWDIADAGWIHGLKVVAVAVVAQAVWGMMRNLAPDRERGTIMIITALFVLLWPYPYIQVLAIVVGGLIGRMLLSAPEENRKTTPLPVPVSRRTALMLWVVFFVLLVSLPLFRPFVDGSAYALFDSFYRVGSLVFGGGHVVLPLLQGEVVSAGWVGYDEFVAGYGAAQAVPGPLFTFAGYLGAVADTGLNGIVAACVAVVAIFLPSFLLVGGALPFWDAIRNRPAFQTALMGVNAAVVGILLAALYDPVFTSTVHSPGDFMLALVAFALLVLWKLPPWVVVAVSALGGSIAHWLGL